ncbi:4-alpha-glucanotransferase [uncultured Clostridium sp.]|uniref:4-alpha-glucanotransferase n=1 Tax=uncultured Clostridium sp. TaxID=59620 RepID=UPI002611E0B0|nr:4-alpha-glucanotransferase [uncultured Clostridium sp.]
MRKSGIILPIFSLPSRYGIGTFGNEAYKFVDFLKKSGQGYWQILPIGPTSYGDSPYQSFSTFAGNPYFIDLEILVNSGFLTKEEVETFTYGDNESYINYSMIYESRYKVLRIAYKNKSDIYDEEIKEFKDLNRSWLGDYALFMALKDYNNGASWNTWDDDIKFRTKEGLDKYKKLLKEDIDFYIFVQYLFYSQWDVLKRYANENGIEIIGDIPIYVAEDSADTWANTHLFKLDENLMPISVAGCPPDDFSSDGQLWGNPIYNWKALEKEDYGWWVERVRAASKLFDVTRIDHFRGFESYWSIPFGDKTAAGGHWEKGPGYKLFKFIKKELGSVNIIAEDLGSITPEVKKLLKECNYPGMKVLQFAFDVNGDSEYLPHNYCNNSVVYTSTHDSDTVKGWYDLLGAREKEFFEEYVGHGSSNPSIALIKSAMSSIANTSMMQIQDLLNIGNEARTNIPSTIGENWRWRLKEDTLSSEIAKSLKEITKTYRRCGGNMGTKIMNDENLKELIEEYLLKSYGKTSDKVTLHEMHSVVSKIAIEKIAVDWNKSTNKFNENRHAYYFSAEFLVGRAIENNLICIGVYEEFKKALKELGFDINEFEKVEDMALGNGGLGRLAACFLDSAATTETPLNGYGIRYKYGLFKQAIVDGFQKEYADNWTAYGDDWSIRKFGDRVSVKFSDIEVLAVPYDMPIIGYKTDNIGTLRLWQSEAIDDFDFNLFNISRYNKSVQVKVKAENITAVLYPNDNTRRGKVLRYKQQYFFTSASIQDLVREYCTRYGEDFDSFIEFNTIQLNDTHPVLAIPEFIRVLTENHNVSFDEALRISRNVFNYTNHTVMAEALEKWDVSIVRKYTPSIYSIIERINGYLIDELRFLGIWENELYNYEIIAYDKVHMARMATYIAKHVNGVAQIHSEILKRDTLKEWYNLYPDKFQNKTNGVTQRRWLAVCNPELTDFLGKLVGDKSFVKNLDKLKKIEDYVDDDKVINEYIDIKREKKRQLIDYIEKHEGIRLSEDFIFDIQIKRLHEYKRQFMNALSILDIYYRLKDGEIKDFTPTAYIFGAKSAPGYARAKAIIKYINEIANLINNDTDMQDKMKVVFVQNYNVSYAEKLIPAANVSEQISTAGTEASGTGNMKFMINGAVTLGTYDGANIEICREAGDINNYIFGAREEEILNIKDSYNPRWIYDNDKNIRRVLDSLVNGTFNDGIYDEHGTIEGSFKELYNSLLNGTSWHRADHYYILNDFNRYFEARMKLNREFKDKMNFARKCFINTANAGFFSSDRTITEYAKDIWNLSNINLK